jgi:hypothetical protein
MGLGIFPGSAVEVAALPSEMGSMGSFQWKFVEYKTKMAFFGFPPVGTGDNAGGRIE